MDIKELIGVTLGNCTLERTIGRGGMGAVFLAQQARPVRTVAIKVLVPNSGADPDDQRVFLERFRREADTVARLEHKNILPVYEYDEAVVDGQQLAYLVMPYIRGGTLRERIDEMKREGKKFDLNTVSNYIGQIAEALSYAHSLGVVHRDVKPANLLFHPDGRLLLSDFGIVRLSAMPALTTAGNFLGTAEYASPEQASAQELDARSDIYSLGIMLYELLTGNVPFTGPNPFVVLSKQINEPVPSMRGTRPDLSPAIEFVVRKALAKNPRDRYQSATEMAADLRAAISPALAAPGGLRLGGIGGNSDLTVADSSWQPPLPQAIPVQQAAGAIPPTSPAVPIAPAGGAMPFPRQPGQWHWPSQSANPPLPQQAGQGAMNATPKTTDEDAINRVPTPIAQRQARRFYFYGVIVIALLLQLFVLGLLLAPTVPATATPAILGILTGASINLLALAAICFTGITRNRRISTNFNRSLAVALIAPIVSGFFISFGASPRPNDIHQPFLAYVVLLVSNLYTLRQLGAVDAAREQVEVAPVHWRSAIIGALTGLLPLTLILVLTLSMPTSLPSTDPLLLRIFGILFIAAIGAPTPGAVLAVWLSRKMTFPILLRSSALAGMFMFVGAVVLASLWSGLTASHTLLFNSFSQPGLAFFVGLCALALIGALRGMLDAWVYQRVISRRTN